MSEGEQEERKPKKSGLTKILRAAALTALPFGTFKLFQEEIEETKPPTWKKYLLGALVGAFETAKLVFYGFKGYALTRKYDLVRAY
jgi:hypothetical protein